MGIAALNPSYGPACFESVMPVEWSVPSKPGATGLHADAYLSRFSAQAGNDLRHVEPEFKLQAHVLAFLAGQAATHGDAHVLCLQDAHDPRQRRADGIRPVAGFAQGRADERF